MSDIIQLKAAKYKGVEFLFEDMPTTGGNRLIKYNFPGSDKQSIERQGRAPRSFTLIAIIPHENYYIRRDALLHVLEDGERGVLTHPTFGDVENVINGVYSLREITSELGRAKITIPFEIDDQPGVPQQSGNLPSQIASGLQSFTTQLETDLADQYFVNSGLTGNFSDALSNVAQVPAIFGQASEFSQPLVDNIAGFRKRVASFSAAVGGLIQTPSALASEISGLFEDLGRLYDSPKILFGAFQLLFGFGASDPATPPTTTARIERVNNRNLLRTNMRGQALGYAYLNAALTEYQTTVELEEAIGVLEAQYLDMRNNQQLTDEAQEQLDVLRVQTYAALDAIRINTRSIITIETPLRPLSVLVYAYYGSTELVDTIADLNNITQNAFVEGELRILET